MRVQCPKCQTVLQLAGAPPAGTKIQCGQCGAQFGVQSRSAALKPVVLPSTPGSPRVTTPSRPVGPVPVAVTEIPEAILDEPAPVPETDFDPSLPPLKKKKKRKFKKRASQSNTGLKLVAAVVVALIAFGVVGLVVWKSGIFRTRTLVEFNDEMVSILMRLDKSGESMMQVGGMRNPADAMKAVDRVGSLVATALADVKRIPPPAEGVAFHGATVKLLERLDKFFKKDIKDALGMVTAGRQNEAMQMMFGTMAELQQLQTAVVAAQHEFAQKNGFQLMVDPFGKGR